MFKKLVLAACGLMFLAGVTVSLVVLAVYMPRAWAIEKQAAERSIQVRVVDRDSDAPIAGATVCIRTRYPSYSPFIMANYRSDERGYLTSTDAAGLAEIPLTFFLIKGLRCDRVMFPFIRDIRFADLPATAEIRAWHPDYTIAKAKVPRGTGPFLASYDQDDIVELKLRATSLLNTTDGLLSKTDGRNFDGDGPTPRLTFYYKIDADKKKVAKTRDEDDADFAIQYETIPCSANAYNHAVYTSMTDTTTCKFISSIEALGGVAEPAAHYFADIGETAHLDFKRSLPLPPLDARPSFTVAVVRSKDSQYYATISVGVRQMGWMLAGESSRFSHGRPTTQYTHSSLSKGCREFDPNSAPDHRHW